jgi:hypothetical protein
VHVQLVKEWRRLPIGHVMRDYPDGAGELLVRRGIGIVYNDTASDRSNDRADKRTVDRNRGKDASKPSNG